MDQADRMNYVTVGLHGTFRPVGSHLTNQADVDAIVAHVAAGAKPLVIHFHGGLVSEAHGMRSAASLTPIYSAVGCHPLSIIWETGFLETVSRNIESIYKAELFQEVLKIVLRRAAKRLGLEAGARGSGREFTQAEIEAELIRPAPFEDAMVGESSSARGGTAWRSPTSADEEKQTVELLEEEIQEDLTGNKRIEQLLKRPEQIQPLAPSVRETLEAVTPGARGAAPLYLVKPLVTVTYRILLRYWRGRQHGFYPTVIEEILRELYLASVGRWIWGCMKNSARDMFSPNSGLEGMDLHVGTYLLEKVTQVDLPVHLVGHSAGSIAICELLATTTRLGLKFQASKIVFLAPAATSELFYREIVSQSDRFDIFRMLTMEDSYESKDILVPYVYPRSLLYLVSGILEEETDAPLCGMQRFLTAQALYEQPNLVAVRDFLQKENRLVLSKTGETAPEGLRSGALKHGGFIDDPLTRESVQLILRS